ncbi:hypothetical protein [Anaplasma platys]|uniref:hypothetical protein n=1 Tax=Anaplasma platys TaxID=949 RepID=UPI00145F9590|nr:hypothetical protein [Anaplasma platys]
MLSTKTAQSSILAKFANMAKGAHEFGIATDFYHPDVYQWKIYSHNLVARLTV